MDSAKVSALLLISMLFVSTVTPILGCRTCGKPKHKGHKGKTPKRPIIPLPPIVKPPINLPPITLPPVLGNPPKGKPCPPPPAAGAICPVDTLKLGACVDLVGGLVHIGLGDPVVNQCCPLISGLVELEAAVCLCTTLKLKLLNLNLYVPLALQLLVTCGKTVPPRFTCTI